MATKRASLIAALILISIGVTPLFAEEDGSSESPAFAKLRQALQGNRESFFLSYLDVFPMLYGQEAEPAGPGDDR
jgi:hypothetical protein